MRNFFRFIFGVITGAFIGSALVVLLTPYSGGDLRRQLISRIFSIRDDIQQAALAKRVELENELANLRKNIPIE